MDNNTTKACLALLAIHAIVDSWQDARVQDRVTALEVAATQTVLVGRGCEGPSAIAVAVEEDILPRCQLIERHNVARTY